MRYSYPDDWATYTPLQRGEYERHFGAFGRRIRLLLRLRRTRLWPRYKGMYWHRDGWRWEERAG